MDQGVIDYIANVFDIPKLTQPVSAVQMPLPLSRLAEIPLDATVNQCQGFCYNSKKDVFVLACINSENTKQIIYEINPKTFDVVAKYEYSHKKLLGHMNTLTYNPNNNRYYTTNAVVDGYIVTPIEADSMIVEAPIRLKEKVFNFAFDKDRNEYVSIVPLTNSLRTINYYDFNFNKIKTYKIDAEHTDLNNNGAYAGNGNTIFTTLTTFVFVDEEGVVKNISPYTSGMEVEDMDYRNGQMYLAVNRKGKVEIYSLPSLPFSVNAQILYVNAQKLSVNTQILSINTQILSMF